MKSPIAAIAVTIALATALPGEGAHAQQSSSGGAGDRIVSLGVGIPDDTVTSGYIGLAALASSDYEGVDEMSAFLVPLIDIRRQGLFFLNGASVNPNDGVATLGWNALNLDYTKMSLQRFQLSAGPMLRFSRGRDPDGALRGLGDIDDGATIGAFVEASAGPWSADITFGPQEAGRDDDGNLTAFSTRLTAQPNDRLDLSFGVSAAWGDDDYMQGFFGLTPAQAAATGLTAFNAGAGMKDVGLQIGATYEISDKFVIVGEVGYQRLLDDAADSPIVTTNGSRNQIRTLFGVAYQFGGE